MSEAGLPNAAESSAPPASRSFAERLLGVLRLDAGAYDDVAADRGALGQSVAVVLAAATGSAISAPAGPASAQAPIIWLYVAALWPVVSVLVTLLGRSFGHTVDFARVLRTIGFAFAPYALRALGLVPNDAVKVAVQFLATALLLATLVVGVRHALQTTTGRAGFICVVIALVLLLLWMASVYLTAA
jgi:hypothetical protein